jgi:radical SAM superfamily enzyme YgiQ (UPF0313 family)
VNFLLVYPSWPKLNRQSVFHLPPHGPVVMAACIPSWVDVTFADENVQPVPFAHPWDFVGISVLLTAQLPRAFEISARFMEAGTPVIFGGIAAMLHADDVHRHCTSLFFGEAEGRLEGVFEDLRNGRLKSRYDYQNDFPPIEHVGTARRSILDYGKYVHKGVRMADLFHASRGCRFNCFPCCTPFLGGRQFRPRPMRRVEEELASIDNDRLFIVDNSLAQDKAWELELFRTMEPFRKVWCSHPIQDDDEVLEAAARAGAWYVYQAIFDMSDHIRNRIRRYKSFGMGVEGTVILGTDDHDEDYIRRLVDFLLAESLDLAEFTVLTPFAHTSIREMLARQGRILTEDYALYTADRAVFRPKHLTPQKLEEMYRYAWDTFYRDEPQAHRMYRLFARLGDRVWPGPYPTKEGDNAA